jgi:hypothetical protein
MAQGQVLTFQQIEQVWTSNGGSPGWAPLMAGIAIAESGGNIVALNNTPATGDYSVGLWQINYYNGLLASRTNAYGSPAALQNDVNLQAKAAISLFANGAGIRNWQGDATYKAWAAAGSPSQPSAATVQSWIGGSGGGGGGSATAPNASSSAVGGVGATDLSQCVLQAPGFLFLSGPCFLTKGGVKWLSGAFAVVAGVGLAGFGVVLLASAVGKSTGATQAAGKAARTIGIGGSLLAGQPEVAGAIAATPKKAPAAPKAAPARTPEPRPAGRIQSRQIERRYQSAERQQGPIGPRGANPTSTRVAREQRRGTSMPGARRPYRQPPNVPGGRPF